MNNTQGAAFGSLTAKFLQKVDFEKLDLNKDGIISEEELASILEKNELDMLDLSTIDKDADLNVTKEEYDLWQQEAAMKDFLDKMKQQARLDMAGHDSEDTARLLDKMNDFQEAFEEQYLKNGNDVNSMTKAFKEAFPEKYKEMRDYVLKNSKFAVKERAIENVLNDLSSNAAKGGRSLMGIVDGKNVGLSDKARMVLKQALSKEADKFIKKYSGESLETDLIQRLKVFLNETDRDKLSDSISSWTKVKASINVQDEKTSLNDLKSFAQVFLSDALAQGLTLNFAGTIIRTATIIGPLLNRFSDPTDLKNAIEDCLNQISSQSTTEKAMGIQPAGNNQNSVDFFNADNVGKNIFG